VAVPEEAVVLVDLVAVLVDLVAAPEEVAVLAAELLALIDLRNLLKKWL
jgi:hypothetical protein